MSRKEKQELENTEKEETKASATTTLGERNGVKPFQLNPDDLISQEKNKTKTEMCPKGNNNNNNNNNTYYNNNNKKKSYKK